MAETDETETRIRETGAFGATPRPRPAGAGDPADPGPETNETRGAGT
ncbi:hypothetical protein ABT224_19920 [Streptomyces sp. NPDC001584]